MKNGPLAGFRIVEFAGFGPGPFAAMMLADMGADIIRIDRPDVVPAFPDPIIGRGRPRVAADLKDRETRNAILDLVDGADALIEGFRPGIMERLGLGPEALIGRNPKLVYARMTGWGQSGPLASKAGHDINYISLTGALAAVGPAERPMPPLNLVGDYGGGGLYLVAGILAALLSAKCTGQGQVVDCAMCDGALSLMSLAFEMRAADQWRIEREANLLDGGAPYYGTYRCSDGLFLAVGAIESAFHAQFCEGLELAQNLFADRENPAAWPRLRALVGEVIIKRTRAEWLERFEDLDACISPVLTFEEAVHHPHLQARNSVIEIDGLWQPAPAPRFSETPSRVHSDQRQLLDLDAAVERWKDRA